VARAQPPANAHQMVLVIGDSWNSSLGQLQRYRRVGEGWKPVGQPWEISLGRSGLGWGENHDLPAGAPIKHEGDGRSPAGVFGLPTMFGKPANARRDFPFLKLGPNWVGVDDPKSKFYNTILDKTTVKPDWHSAEHMWISIYELGLVVDYNLGSDKVPGRGSCIFVHSWFSPTGESTSGCTAMTVRNLHKLCDWLRADEHPVLVQLPRALYAQLEPAWHLP
jgi:D-alanyl-D-alanine dipeptidase